VRAIWQEAVENLFGSMSRALFTSMNMLFFGSDPELLSKAPYPTLAMLHYIFYVSSHPCSLLWCQSFLDRQILFFGDACQATSPKHAF
jgi:hypothetical protein